MTKTNVIEMVTTNNAKLNKETNRYEMTQKSFDKLIENDFPDTLKMVKSKKEEGLYCIASRDGKTRYVAIQIVKTSKKTNKEVGAHGHKAKGNAYRILLKNMDDKKEKVITDMTTCAEIKLFIKELPKKQVEYLRIYDANNHEVRKSAWIER